MTKSKTIIATLGIVAGLGAAALPLASYAAQTNSVSGTVELQAYVEPAIAMTIKGNDDVASPLHNATTSLNYSADGFGDEAPAGADVDGYDHTSNNHDTITSSSYMSVFPGSAKNDQATSVITVYTNDAGYTLGVQAAGANLVKDANNSIAPIATADTAPTVGTNEGWGFKTAKTSGSGAVTTTTTDFTKWNAVPTAAAQLASSSSKTSNGDVYTVNYGVAIGDDVETGYYKQTITYTATSIN